MVGGYDCVYAHVGPVLFPDFDYMVIFEGELTIGPLVSALARGQRPKDVPGILSRFDSPGRVWESAPLLADLDSVDYPRYQWADNMVLYQTYDRKHLVPITASRGCKWGRCRFCGERFPFRNRTGEDRRRDRNYVPPRLAYLSLQRKQRQRQSPDAVRPMHGRSCTAK